LFEKFTEKAINVVSEAQKEASAMNSEYVTPEHLLLALVKEARGISLKLFKMNDISYEKLRNEVESTTRKAVKQTETIPFRNDFKDILKKTLDLATKSGHTNILFEHLFLAVLSDKNGSVNSILEHNGFDIYKSKDMLTRLVQKKVKKLSHPEAEEVNIDEKINVDSLFEDREANSVLQAAVAKLSASNFEILGTEQIISSILENANEELLAILKSFGITSEKFEEKLSEQESRKSEYGTKQIIFTPNAFHAMNLAIQTAKELGSSVVSPEHMILGLLKTKKGIAYDIFKTFNINDDDLAHSIIKPIEKQMPETLRILRLAKEETRRIGRNVVGTEMFLLGILAEGAGVGATVLQELEITIKDVRTTVENIIGYGDEYFDTEIIFTPRAKKVLEKAWKFAKDKNKPRIESDDLLLAITTEPTSLAMRVLEQLGVDALEIKYGIIKESNAN